MKCVIHICGVLVGSALLAAAPVSPAAGTGTPTAHSVEIKRFSYVPSAISVKPGDSITWINHDIVPHTVTGRGEGWDSASIAAGAKWTMTVNEAMAGGYFCRFHPAMTGDITVELGRE